MDDDLIWTVVIILGVIGIILALFGGYTLMEITETPYDKCIESCRFSLGTTGSADLPLKAECLKSCQGLTNCEVSP